MFLEIEAALTILAVVLACTAPNLGSRWFEALERSFGRLAQRRGLSVVVTGLTALALRAALLPILPVPQPCIQDEFGYLLLSDTFAHGRLTNPTNPMWVHFESPFIIWHPTYTTMFYPAQGLFMALGQVLTGVPFWGVWLSVGLMCATITWMLQGWIDPGWALLGGSLAVIRFGTFNYWANSYWGGAVTAIGGALVLGALPRLKRKLRAHDAVLMGLGFAIIANSRPYEGLFFGTPVAISILVWLWKMRRPELGRALKRAMVPLLAVLGLTMIAMGYYFWRTTGSPFNTPYLVEVHTYDPVPYFPWQAMKPIPAYRHPEFRRYYLHTVYVLYSLSRTVSGSIMLKLGRLALMWSFFFGPVFTLPLLVGAGILPYGFSWRSISPQARFLMAACGAVIVANMLPIWYTPHYSAVMTCALLALVLFAMRYVRGWQWHHKPAGLFITRAVPSICVLLLALRAAAGPLHLPLPPKWPSGGWAIWCSSTPKNPQRAAVLRKLRRDPGRQLVIVHYDPDYDIYYHEWIYNRADIDSAKVIWARDMGPAENDKLIHFFMHRHAWLIDLGAHPPELLPYSGSADRQLLSANSEERVTR